MTKDPILIVEDDADLALLIGSCLASAGYSYKAAVDGSQATTYAHQLKPPLVILDFMFPSGGGGTFHAALRASTYASTVPILILSAVPEEVIVKKIDMDGDTYYLEKPFKKDELLETIRQILS